MYAEFIFIVNTPVIDRHITYLYRNVHCDTHNEQLTSPLLGNTLDLCRLCFQKIMYVEYFCHQSMYWYHKRIRKLKRKCMYDWKLFSAG